MQSIRSEVNTTMIETPVFYEALGKAAHMTPGMAKSVYDEIAEMTDLHRVEIFLEEHGT